MEFLRLIRVIRMNRGYLSYLEFLGRMTLMKDDFMEDEF